MRVHPADLPKRQLPLIAFLSLVLCVFLTAVQLLAASLAAANSDYPKSPCAALAEDGKS